MTRSRRLLWIVNHRTLMQAEVPILHQLGYEVFVPKIIPDDDPGYRSGAVTLMHDESLTVPSTALRVMNLHDFYRRRWTPTLIGILNDHFDVVVTSVSAYLAPLGEAARHFRGTLVARVFGREHPRRYTEFFLDDETAPILDAIDRMGDRFIFGQGYPNLAEIEVDQLRKRAYTITVPLPERIFTHQDEWNGRGDKMILLCPGISSVGYYRELYDRLKRDFGDLPHAIFGGQIEPHHDPAVLPYLTDEALVELYRRAPVFVYPSTEPRHVHYSPVEAMAVGTPVLYRRGGLIDELVGKEHLPGACRDVEEMRAKASALLAGDRGLADAIRVAQRGVLDEFSAERASEQWNTTLARVLPPR